MTGPAADLPLRFAEPVTLVGDGALDPAMLEDARAIAPVLVAADGAADRLAAMGLRAAAAIGDMDSIGPRGRAAVERVVALAEQDTTDFEKCLYATEAPFYLAVGFTGARIDHTLAVLHAVLARPDKQVVLIGEAEVMAFAPHGRAIRLVLPAGARVSVFPLLPVRGTSEGLRWPLDGLALAPGERIGTSNQAAGGPVSLRFEGQGALVMLERATLPVLVAAMLAAWQQAVR